MTREDEARYLTEIRALHADASIDWQVGSTDSGEGLLARLIPQQEPQPVVTFDPWIDRKDREFLLGAHRAIGFLLGLVDRAIAAHRRHNPPAPAQPNYAAECAMKCGEGGFQKFLHEVHGLDHPWDSNRTATKVRSILAIRSRTELNENPAAAEGWKKLRGEYEAWRRRG